MGVSTELINQFVRVTSDKKTRVSESIVLGTVVIDNGKTFAKIDGSTTLTPIKTTTSVNDGDRVTILIKDHTATITGNITSPSLDKGGVSDEVSDQISEFEIIITDEIVAQNGKIDNQHGRTHCIIHGTLPTVMCQPEWEGRLCHLKLPQHC